MCLATGDTAENLIWRLRNGEFPPKMAPKAAIVMIGVNNIRQTIKRGYPFGMVSSLLPACHSPGHFPDA